MQCFANLCILGIVFKSFKMNKDENTKFVFYADTDKYGI